MKRLEQKNSGNSSHNIYKSKPPGNYRKENKTKNNCHMHSEGLQSGKEYYIFLQYLKPKY